jgi:hypothetical protein
MENDLIKGLKEIVQKHTVRYEVWPHFEISEAKRVIVGFDLELYGTHGYGVTHLSPGCHLCAETHADLLRVAEFILPKEQRPSQYEIPPFDRSLHASAGGEFEVLVPIRIEHRHSFFDPVDACEERCLKEMVEKLKELGVPSGRCATVHEDSGHVG